MSYNSEDFTRFARRPAFLIMLTISTLMLIAVMSSSVDLRDTVGEKRKMAPSGALSPRDQLNMAQRLQTLEDEINTLKARLKTSNEIGGKIFPEVKYRNEKSIKRILVTGGAGFVGSHLVDKLLKDGHEVIAMDNYFTGRKRNIEHWIGHPNFELVHHDVINPYFAEVDHIYHLASPASPPHYMYNPVKTIKTNTLGTINMLGLAKRTKATVLLASTSEVYGDPENPLFSPINTRSRRMRPAVESPVNIQSIENGAGSLESTDAGSTSTESNHSPQTSPVPSINVELDYEEKTKFATPQKRPDEFYNSRIRSRSALSSPAHYLNGNPSGRQSPLAASIYAKKIAEKGCKQHAEGSMSSLRTSMSNLSMNGGIENSPNLARYKSMNPAYRSFNMKKTSDKQKETLERLAALREQLRSKENFVTRPGLGGALSRQGSGHSMGKQ